jgi:hypothetical protein
VRLCEFSGIKTVMIVAILFPFFNLAVPAWAEEPQIIGVWDYTDGKDDYKIIIADDEGETVLVKKFKDGIMIRQVVVAAKQGDSTVYKPEVEKDEDSRDYYIVDRSGALQVWDDFGLKTTIILNK